MIKADIDKAVWNALSRLRNRADFVATKESARALEIIGSLLGQEKLERVISDEKIVAGIMRSGSISPPPYVHRFINSISEIVKPTAHLDPWITYESPSNYFNFGKSVSYCKNKTIYDLCKAIFNNDKNEISLSDGLLELNNTNESFDLVTCFPPFNSRLNHDQVVNGVSIPPDLATALLIKSAVLLTEKGKAIFLLPQGFFFNDKNTEALTRLGLCVDAVFYLPVGALSFTNIASCLVVVSKQKTDMVFVAEISSEQQVNARILENYQKRKSGKLFQLGSLQNVNNIKAPVELEAQAELEELIKRTGFPKLVLDDVAISIALVNVENRDEIQHSSNSIYFPKVGNSPVVISPSEMGLRNFKNYFHIKLDSEKVNATYVAHYFNSELGRKIRSSLESGATIPFIPKSRLLSFDLYLPPLSDQVKVVEVNSKIDSLSIWVDELKRNLWKKPTKCEVIEKELNRFDKADNIVEWIDCLPFPLSSILWRYHATNNDGKKIEHLFHFFEALSEFLSMIMLSAIVQDTDLYYSERENIIDQDAKFKDWYKNANFGGWKILVSRLSKLIRKLHSEEETRKLCKALLGNPAEDFTNFISNKAIVNILDDVVHMRNARKGHGGISSNEENSKIVTLLEQQLGSLRKLIADGFEGARIISPGKNEYIDGVYNYEVKELVGVKSPFKEVEIMSLVPLDKKKLYMMHSGQNKPIELLPFIKYEENIDAVYFYSSIKSSNVRWVSYHFESESEKNIPADDEIYKALDYLK